jgi:antagonist of KipI
MQISILKPGLLSTIQDIGRWGYLSQAVPVSGAMDTLSARIANKAVGNTDDTAVIEFTYADAEFKADTDLLLAYCGDGSLLKKAGDQTLPPERPLFIPQGTVIKLINNPTGCRTYLAVAGGWNVPEVLGSRSTFLTARFGGYQGRALKAGDILTTQTEISDISTAMLKQLAGHSINYPDWSIPRQLLLPANRKVIRVVPANEFTWFDSRSIVDFLSKPFMLSQRANRMGYHLEGPVLNRVKQEELLSTAVTPGTIQVTGNGSLVLLTADCQTTGGYPRIAQVAEVDLPLCAQLKPGDGIYFTEISRREAEMLYIEREEQLHKLTTAIRSRIL